MPMYAIALTTSPAVAAAPTDLVEITASTKADLRLCGMVLSRVSTAAVGTTAVDHPLLRVLLGSSANGGTATGVAVNLDSRSQATAQFTALLGTSDIGSAGSTVKVLLAASFNSISGNFVWWPPPGDTPDSDMRPIAKLGERISIRIGPRASALSMTGTVYVQEIPKIPGSGRT